METYPIEKNRKGLLMNILSTAHFVIGSSSGQLLCTVLLWAGQWVKQTSLACPYATHKTLSNLLRSYIGSWEFATVCQHNVVRSCEVAKLRSCEVAKLRSCEVAKLRSCEVTMRSYHAKLPCEVTMRSYHAMSLCPPFQNILRFSLYEP